MAELLHLLVLMIATTFASKPGHIVGDIVGKFESGNNTAAVAHTPGDIGGPSYGRFQIAQNTGTMKAFLDWAGIEGYPPIGTPSFDSWWKLKNTQVEFSELQYGFLLETHYKPALEDYPALADHPATAEAVFAAANGHGPGGARKVIDRALNGKEPLDPKSAVVRIYNERMRSGPDGAPVYYRKSSRNVQIAVMKRLVRERDLILKELS